MADTGCVLMTPDQAEAAEQSISNVHLEDAAQSWRSLERRKPAL